MDRPADRREATGLRARLDARERGLSRAASVTVRVAAGSAAATVAAALVFAQTPPADTVPPAAPGTVVPDAVGTASGGGVGTASGGSSSGGSAVTGGDGGAPAASSGDRLQPPATAPAPVSGRHHHATSSPS